MTKISYKTVAVIDKSAYICYYYNEILSIKVTDND